MKLIVIGASGLVGSHVLKAARLAGHEVLGTFRRCPLPGLVALDCADPRAVEDLLRSQEAKAIIYAAGWTWVDGCEGDPQRAMEENAYQPERVARVCAEVGIHFTYFSTSYVFDGRRGFYAEQDEPRPLNVYSQSKLEGEHRVSAALPGRSLITRVISVFGAEVQRKNFACQVWRALETGALLRVPSDQLGNPTYAGDIGRWTLRLVEQSAAGIWHLASPLYDWTRADWARSLIKRFQDLGVRQQPGFRLEAVATRDLAQKAPRPLNASMDTSKLAALGLKATAFDEAVRQTFTQQREMPPCA